MIALSKDNCALLIDEFKGRNIAKQLHIPVIGLAGLYS
jgi:predicted nucleic acid-binding protein